MSDGARMATRETPTHSPAPWQVDESTDLRDYTGMYICEVYDAPETDRRLILKAPDLLAVVRRHLIETERASLHHGSPRYAELKALVDYIDTGEE